MTSDNTAVHREHGQARWGHTSGLGTDLGDVKLGWKTCQALWTRPPGAIRDRTREDRPAVHWEGSQWHLVELWELQGLLVKKEWVRQVKGKKEKKKAWGSKVEAQSSVRWLAN